MSINEVTRYETSDGKIFADKVQAIKHDALLDTVGYAMDILPKVDLGSDEYFQLNHTQYDHFKQLFDNIIHSYHPDLEERNPAQHVRGGILGRILCDSDSPASKLHWILESIDDKLRWYNQPYYANNPDETVDFTRIYAT